jgi:DNA-binding MarR family transcriptional regulator
MAIKENEINQFASAMLNLASAINDELERCCEICGNVNEKELMLIVFVGDNTSVKMSEIAENLKAPLSTLTSIADKLVANKILTRYNSDEDRRVVKVSLTEKGRESYRAFVKRRKERAKMVLSNFSQKEHPTLIAHINMLASSIKSEK